MGRCSGLAPATSTRTRDECGGGKDCHSEPPRTSADLSPQLPSQATSTLLGCAKITLPAGKLGHGKRTFRLAKELNVVLTGPEYAQRRLTHRDYGDDWQGDNLDGGPIERDSNSRPSGYNHSVDRPEQIDTNYDGDGRDGDPAHEADRSGSTALPVRIDASDSKGSVMPDDGRELALGTFITVQNQRPSDVVALAQLTYGLILTWSPFQDQPYHHCSWTIGR